MSILKVIADLSGALEANQADYAAASGQMEALKEERARIARAQPHTDDIVAVFMRGVQDAKVDFEQQFKSHLKAFFSGADGAAEVGERKSGNILRLEANKLGSDAQITRSMRGELPALNVAVLAYFLRDKIASDIPDLVDRLFPEARSGMKGTDREQALKDIDAQIAHLRTNQEALTADRIELRKILGKNGMLA